jgi:hypothetical protein
MNEETTEAWFRSGFTDGRHGNSKWPPEDKVAAKAYREGYAKGRYDLRNEQRERR